MQVTGTLLNQYRGFQFFFILQKIGKYTNQHIQRHCCESLKSCKVQFHCINYVQRFASRKLFVNDGVHARVLRHQKEVRFADLFVVFLFKYL
jgi:hypothetical protein